MSFFLINDIRLNLPMGWVPFQLLYLGPFSNVRCTTFSSFADDMWVLGSKGDWTTFILYLALSVILGVLLVWGGRALIR